MFVDNDDLGLRDSLAEGLADANLDELLTGLTDNTLPGDDRDDLTESEATNSHRVELVIIDSNVAGVQQLIDDLAADSNKTILVHVLDANTDGVAQISEMLSLHSNLDAVHLISHGSTTGMQIGSTLLDIDNLGSYQQAIAGWADSFANDADLLIYGCNLAGSTQGQDLLSNLSSLTGTDVAASTDLTGQATLGGDWDLEYNSGEIETAVVFSGNLQQNWESTLPISSRETEDTDGDGQIDRIKITADAALNDDFTDLTVTVAGYVLDATMPFITGLDNDAVLYVNLVESGAADTGATPTVTIVTNTQLSAGGFAIAPDGGIDAADKAAAVITSPVETVDLDGDGFIDAVHITFSEAILDTSIIANDFDVTGVISEAFSSTTNGDTANDNDIYITFTDGVLDTGATPDVTYAADGGTDVQDLAGNLARDKVGWWDADWQNRTEITFDNSNSSENLDNFPVLIALTSAEVDYAKIQDQGQDLRFYDEDTAQLLNYEIGLWNEGGTSYVWVSVPRIDASVATDSIMMYYNNTAAVDAQNVAGVWGADYDAVWHLNEIVDDGVTTGIHVDSTGGHNGTQHYGDDATGRIGLGQQFDGNNDYITIADDDVFTYSDGATDNPFSVSAWVSVDTATHNMVVAKYGATSTNAEWGLEIDSAGKLSFYAYDIDGDYIHLETVDVFPTGALHHVAATYEGTGSSAGIKLFIDGVEQLAIDNSSGTYNVMSNTSVPVLIGAYGAAENAWDLDGVIDEVRISSINRSADWVQASYLSQNGTFVFNAFGAEQGLTADKVAAVITSPVETVDLDGDGFIDAVHITFSEAILDTSIIANDFDVVGVIGEAFSSTTRGDTANDNDIYITFTDGVLDTGATPDVTYAADGGTDVQDLAGNLAQDKVGWWDTDWLNRTKITFDNTSSGEDLTDFPILVKLTAADIDFTKIQAGGTDLRFLDSDGTPLSYEIELWNDMTETAVVWVKVPQVNQSVATDYIYLYYNNTLAVGGQNPTDVWPAATGVWHLGEDLSIPPVSGNILDSDATPNNGTSFPAMTAADSVSGQIGSALDFDGASGDYIGFSSTEFGVGATNQNFTISVWIKPDGGITGINTILANSVQGAFSDGFRLFINTADEIRFETGDGLTDSSSAVSRASVIVADQWNQITVVVDRDVAGSTATIFLNGVNVTINDTIENDFNVTSDWQLGQMESGDSRFNGVIDELQITSGLRSADWVKASYLSQSGAFNLLGVEESLTMDKAAPVLLAAVAFPNQSGLQLNFSEAIYTTTGGAGALQIGDFTYGNVAAGGATGIVGVAEANGSDGAVTLQTNSAITSLDFDTDTIAVVAGQVFDAVDNAANVDVMTIVNRAPMVDLHTSGGIDYAFTFTEGDAATNIVGTTSITDVDDTNLVSVILDVGGVVDGAAETLTIGNLTFALNAADFTDNTVVVGTGTYSVDWVQLTGIATVTLASGDEMTIAQADAVLQASLYRHTDTNNPTAGTRTFAVTVNDGFYDS
ncbi:MAG: hypothetical protein ACI9SB_002363, partial [Candidatus Azotimanducaceae bacterium]